MGKGLIIDREGAVLTLTIDRPEASNALDSRTSAAMDAAITEAEADESIAVIILTGAGERAFCAGMDMKEAAAEGAGRGLVPGRGFAGVTERQRTKPLIAAVNGAAVAGGFELCLACDLVYAAEHAVFGLSEVKRGLFAFAGGVQRLARTTPRAAAMQMILTGDTESAARLYELGLISAVFSRETLMTEARAAAARIAAYDRSAVRNAKLLFDLAAEMPVEQSLKLGGAFGRATLAAPGAGAGVAAYARGRRD